MSHLTPPTLGAREVLQLSTSTEIRRDKSELPVGYEELVARAADRYGQACRTASPYELDTATFDLPEASKTDAVDLTANGPTAASWQVGFFVRPPSEQGPHHAAHHSKAFNLDKLYEEQTADGLVTVGHALEDVLDAGGSTDTPRLSAGPRTLSHQRAVERLDARPVRGVGGKRPVLL